MIEVLLGTETAKLVAGLICGVLTEISFRAYDQGRVAIGDHLRHAAEHGKLPINHDVERAIARAHLRACHALILDIPADLLPDQIVQPGHYRATWVSPNDTARNALIDWLSVNIVKLRHDQGTELRRRQTAESVLGGLATSVRSLPGDAVDRLAGLNVDATAGASAACAQILTIAGWKDDGPRKAVAAKFNGKGGWPEAFALCFAAELKDDDRLHRVMQHIGLAELRIGQRLSEQRIVEQLESLQFSVEGVAQNGAELLRAESDRLIAGLTKEFGTLSALIETAFTSLQQRFLALQQRIDALHRAASWQGRFLLRSPSQPNAPTSERWRPFHYSARVDDFVGREADIEAVRSILLDEAYDSEMFRWLAVCGEAGVGKSRFAQELIAAFSGSWLAGFVTADAIRTENFSRQVEIGAPTLIVADYGAAFRGSFPDFMEGWIQRTGDLAHPVRVLILVRRTTDPVLGEICRRAGSHQGGDIAERQAGPPLVLAKLETEAHTLDLMRGRMRKTAEMLQAEPREISNFELLEKLDSFDRQRRPLFAAIVADAIQRDTLPKSGRQDSGQEDARYRLFTDFLADQRANVWQDVASEEAGGNLLQGARMRRRHETLAMLSTLVRGLSFADFEELIGESTWTRSLEKPDVVKTRDLLCLNPTGDGAYNRQLLHYILGRESPDEEEFATLEPDLIGECFVLAALQEAPPATDDQEKEFHDRRRKCLLDLAWTIDPEGAATFARLAAQDYFQSARSLNWLQPSGGAKRA